jgi:hypothetical protein
MQFLKVKIYILLILLFLEFLSIKNFEYLNLNLKKSKLLMFDPNQKLSLWTLY